MKGFIPLFVLIGLAGIAIGILGYQNFHSDTPLLGAQPAFTTFQGGTGSTSPSGILYGDGTIGLKTVTIGSNLSFAAGSLSATGGGGGSFPFSATTNYSQTVYATSTPTLWFQSGVFASSTSHFVNADFTNSTSTNATSTTLNVTGALKWGSGSGLTLTTSGLFSNITTGTVGSTGVLGVSGGAPAYVATSTLYGAGVAGQVLGWDGSKVTWVATSTCVEITGSASLCDGDDATGAGGGSSFGQNFNFVAGTPNYLIGTTSPLGMILTASSTIGSGTQTGGLTINGGATTTGDAVFGGNIKFSAATAVISFSGTSEADFNVTRFVAWYFPTNVYSNTNFILSNTSGGFELRNGATSITSSATGNINVGTPTNANNGTIITGNIGLGTTTPYAQLSILATSTTGVNAPTTLFAIASTTAGTATTTLFSVGNTGVGSLSVGSTTQTLSAITGLLTLGSNGANGSSTISTGKLQFDTYNSAGTRSCIFLVDTTFTAVAGACNP